MKRYLVRRGDRETQRALAWQLHLRRPWLWFWAPRFYGMEWRHVTKDMVYGPYLCRLTKFERYAFRHGVTHLYRVERERSDDVQR